MKKSRKNEASHKGADLNSTLGSMNIEPPRRYRDEQRANKSNLNKTEIRRRQSKKRRLKNNVRRALIAISLFVVLISVGVVLSLTVFFKITAIEVIGSGVYSSEQVIDNCNINYGDNLFLIKTSASKEKLVKTLPYIYDVKITRKIPSTVVFEITDAKVEYYIQNEDETAILLDDNFKVLESNAQQGNESAVKITDSVITAAENGETIVFENEAVSECLTTISNAVKSTGMEEATSISSIDANNNYIVYEGRIVFALGSCDNIENKIYKGLAACEKLNESAPKASGTLDLSNDKQIYFTEK